MTAPREVTAETMTMKQIADLKAVSKGKLRADCVRAEASRDATSIWPTLQRIAAAINARAKAGTK